MEKTLYVKSAKEWRAWLEVNFRMEDEIWLVYPRKSSGRERIPYNDAVEEALCFGWIDSTVKTLDEEHTMQRFTPRKRGSSVSQANRERLKWLMKQDRIHPSVKEDVEEIINKEFTFPDDILQAIRKDALAWNNFQQFSESYKRIRIAYINSARKRPEEFEKRLANFLDKTRQNRLIIGFGGIDKYY